MKLALQKPQITDACVNRVGGQGGDGGIIDIRVEYRNLNCPTPNPRRIISYSKYLKPIPTTYKHSLAENAAHPVIIALGLLVQHK